MTIRKEGKQKRKIRRKELRRVPLILGRVVEKKVFSLPFPSVLEAISSFSSILERAEVNSDRATGKLRYTWARITEGKEKRNFIGFSTRPREIRMELSIPLLPYHTTKPKTARIEGRAKAVSHMVSMAFLPKKE